MKYPYDFDRSVRPLYLGVVVLVLVAYQCNGGLYQLQHLELVIGGEDYSLHALDHLKDRGVRQ